MQRFRRMVGLLCVMVMMIAALAMIVPVAAQDTSKTLIVTSLSDVNSLDPALGYDTVSWPTESLVYRGLVTWDDEGKEVVPALAEKVDASTDGLKFTFMLRKGVKFSNGREITADDVKYTCERQLNPKTAYPGTFIFDLIAGAKDYMDGKATEVSGIKIVDPATV